jgi:hypothetical protein
MYVLSIIYLQPLNHKSTASGASLASGESQESLESRSSEGENGRLKINVAENVRSLVHFRAGSRRLVAQETRTVPGRRLACSGAPPHVARP